MYVLLLLFASLNIGLRSVLCLGGQISCGRPGGSVLACRLPSSECAAHPIPYGTTRPPAMFVAVVMFALCSDSILYNFLPTSWARPCIHYAYHLLTQDTSSFTYSPLRFRKSNDPNMQGMPHLSSKQTHVHSRTRLITCRLFLNLRRNPRVLDISH